MSNKETSAQKKNYKKIKKPFLFPQNNLITSFFICGVKRQRQNDSAIQICEALQLINPYSKLFAVVFNLLERKYEPYTAFEAVHHHSKDSPTLHQAYTSRERGLPTSSRL